GLGSVERPFAGASAVHIPGATPRRRTGLVPAVLPASTEQGKRKGGFPRNLGRPTVSTSKATGSGGGLTRTPLPPSRRRAGVERRTQAHGVVTVSRRQRRGRQGRPGIGALHSTAEAGELVPRGPGGGTGAPGRGSVAGQQRGGVEPRSAVHETTTGSAAHVSPRRDEPDALMGHVRICGRRRGQPRRRPGPKQIGRVVMRADVWRTGARKTHVGRLRREGWGH